LQRPFFLAREQRRRQRAEHVPQVRAAIAPAHPDPWFAILQGLHIIEHRHRHLRWDDRGRDR
jgi:hypothetical protein